MSANVKEVVRRLVLSPSLNECAWPVAESQSFPVKRGELCFQSKVRSASDLDAKVPKQNKSTLSKDFPSSS